MREDRAAKKSGGKLAYEWERRENTASGKFLHLLTAVVT